MARPIEVFLLDLDNTLYTPARGLMDAVSRRITAFMVERYGLSEAEANRWRQRFFHRHGTTLRGLQAEGWPVDPAEYLHFVHDPRHLRPERYLHPDPELRQALATLGGRRYIFTNAPRHHARAVLAALGVEDLIDGIFSVEDTDYLPKPDPHPYRVVLERLGVDPRRCCMADDAPQNLRPAHGLGMLTVWIRPPTAPEDASPPWVDLILPDLKALPKALTDGRRSS